MAKYRARFNDKARAGGVAKRNALKAKRQKQFHRENEETDITEQEKAEKAARVHEMARPESDARKRVRMAIQFPERANAAKRKRLEKYIEKQVRKEEKAGLLEQLAKTQSQVHGAQLRSLGALGTGSKAGKESRHKHDRSEDEEEDEDEAEETSEPKPMSFADLESEGFSDDSEGSEQSGEESEGSEGSGQSGDDSGEESEESEGIDSRDEPVKSTFIDNRPSGPALGFGGFGFSNLPEKKPVKPKSKMTWRKRLGIPAAEMLLEKTEEGSDDSEEEDSDSEEVEEESGAEEEEEDEEEDSNEDSDEDSEDSEDSDDGESSGKAFMEWAKSMDPESQTSKIVVETPENYVHQHRKTEGEEAAEAVDSAKSQPGWVERMHDLEPVVIERSEDIQSIRTNLPAVASEQQVMDAVNHFDVVVITGATGSGKTTQIPQFLLESGYARNGMIGVTQPRRVAAVSMAKRISSELCGAAEVGYQIRFDTKVRSTTKIKLMTDGVLLKEMSSDFLLSKYTAIVVDEAHERSVNTDILIGLLSRVVKLRRERGSPLKLVIMSATLRVADFAENTRLFAEKPPVVGIDSRQHPITNHFSRRTPTDYVEEAIKKTKKIHERLPKGGILVFLTGKDEILRAVNELDPSRAKQTLSVRPTAGTSTFEEENIEFGGHDDYIDEENLDDDDQNDQNSDDDSDIELDPEQDPDAHEKHDQSKLHVLPLYSLLSTEDQLKVFEPVPPGHRLCVIATNVAETSLTIPGIRYVVDCGRAKQRVYDLQTGVQKFSVKWVSKASADQRSGRAGRMGPGHCYRLFSSAVFERDFPQFGDPEIVRMPIEGLVLQMKSMGINNITNFPFPTAIPESSLRSGIRVLQNLGAMEVPASETEDLLARAKLTPLGQQMSLFPLHPRHAKMLLIGNQHGCLPYVVALVAALSVQDLFVDSPRSVPVLDPQADVLQLLSAVATYSWTPTRELCHQLGLRPKAMAEVASLRQQLARLVAQTLKSDAYAALTEQLTQPLKVPSAIQLTALRQIVAAGYIDQVVARKALFNTDDVKTTSNLVSRQPYLTVQRDLPSSTVFIHPSTVLQLAPDFLVYSSMTVNDETDKLRVKPLTAITETQLSAIAQNTPLITFSKPLGGAHAPKMIDATTREAWVVPRYGGSFGAAGLGWDLPPRKVTQIRKGSHWVNK